MDLIEALNVIYSPSKWSKRFSNSQEVLINHCEFVQRESAKAKEQIPYETLPYGNNECEQFDIYGTDLPNDAPIVVYIHGGYWQELTKDLSAYFVKPLHAVGIKTVIIEYELCPNISLENLVKQIVKAHLCIGNYAKTIGSQYIKYVGHSAGAHLILCMLDQLIYQKNTNLELLKSIFLISGIYDLNELRYAKSVNDNNLLSLTNKNVTELSPLYFDFAQWKSNEKFTINIYVAENDSPAFKQQSKMLYALMKTFGDIEQNIFYRLIDDCDHFDVVENLCDGSFEIMKDIIDG